jgi:hypothetical protein
MLSHWPRMMILFLCLLQEARWLHIIQIQRTSHPVKYSKKILRTANEISVIISKPYERKPRSTSVIKMPRLRVRGLRIVVPLPAGSRRVQTGSTVPAILPSTAYMCYFYGHKAAGT